MNDFSAHTCAGCGCACDDLRVHVENGQVTAVTPPCHLADRWFCARPGGQPDALIDGQPASRAEALALASRLLTSARYPLIFGMGNTSCEAQRQAVHLAERLGGVIDSHTSLVHSATKMAGQQMGKVTCTLGEVMNRADFVLYWGCDPAVTHPRHLERYSVLRPGRFRPRGRADRFVAAVHSGPIALEADWSRRIEAEEHFETLVALSAMVAGQPLTSAPAWRDLVQAMRRAQFGIIFYGDELATGRGHYLNVAALLALTRQLNAVTKFNTMPMRGWGNEAGADNVLSWTTGFPFAVDFSRGYPRYNPGEYSAADLLERGDVDLLLAIGVREQAILRRVAEVPVIVLDTEVTPLSQRARVHVTTAAVGLGAGGTIYRMDKVPVPVRACVTAKVPSDEEVLRELLASRPI